MNDKIVFGQYIYRNSIIHKLDPRVKLGVLFIMMIGTFLIPKDNFILLGIAFFIPLIAVIFSKISSEICKEIPPYYKKFLSILYNSTQYYKFLLILKINLFYFVFPFIFLLSF